MMVYYYEISAALQTALLILSQMTIIIFVGGFAILLKRKIEAFKAVLVCLMILVNVAVYILMQLDNRVTQADLTPNVPIPCIVYLAVLAVSLVLFAFLMFGEIKNRESISAMSIKESFDTLPVGVCFFNSRGISVLCNTAMHRFSFAVRGKDVQYISDIDDCLNDDFIPNTDVLRSGKTFVLPYGTAWHLEKTPLTYKDGETYIQYLAVDITELNDMRNALIEETKQLRNAQINLKQLSANIVAVTREEEILNAKMRVHDEMGRCLVAAQRYLKSERRIPEQDGFISSWQRAVSALTYSNEAADDDALSQIRKTCEFVNIDFVPTGNLPTDEPTAYILICAIRECVTNAVRYAEATELYAAFTDDEREATVVISNNGKPPKAEITEGGGLSTLRRRVERAGGTMLVQSYPTFRLDVTVPKRKDVEL